MKAEVESSTNLPQEEDSRRIPLPSLLDEEVPFLGAQASTLCGGMPLPGLLEKNSEEEFLYQLSSRGRLKNNSSTKPPHKES
jgi:hypothetical protein